MAYAVRHPGHAGALVLQSTNARVDCPTLVGVGELDPVTPVAAAREIVDALPRGSAAGGDRGGRALHLEGRPRPLLAAVLEFVTATAGTS
jgi:pimeloyl-ACP methyl ester carboxylesterase